MKRILYTIVAVLVTAFTSLAQSYPSGGGHTKHQVQQISAEHRELLMEARTNATTAYKVALRYYTGKRVNPSPANGLAYLKHAATMTNSPNPLAVHDLGVATYWGLGVKADKEEGEKLVRKACEMVNISKPEHVDEIVQRIKAGDRPPFDPVHRNDTFLNYWKSGGSENKPKKEESSK